MDNKEITLKTLFDFMQNKFENIDVRFDGIDNRLDNMDIRITKIDADNREAHSQIVKELQLTNNALTRMELDNLSYRVSLLEKNINN